MRKMKLLLCIMLLVGCTSQQENDNNVVSNSTTSSRPQVYTATPQTTKEPEINIVTTPYTIIAISGSKKLSSSDVAISAAIEPIVIPMI